jgi:hypothetical protein
VSGGGGVSYLDVTTTDGSTWGPTMHGGISYHAGRVVFNARYQRSFLPSYGFGGLSANQSMSVNGLVPFAQGRFYIDGGLSYGRTSPVQELGVGFQLDSLWVSAAAGYQVARWLRAEGFYNGSHQNSTARGNVDRARIGIQFVTIKPVRIE